MTEEKKVECPHCDKAFMIPVDAGPTAAEIAAMVGQETGQIEELLKQYQGQLPRAEDHRHKTADEFLDCEGCSRWFNETTTKYTITPVEQPPAEPPAPEPTEKEPAFGSIFRGGENSG